MNHVITVGDVLRALAGLAGVVILITGFLTLLVGAYGEPTTGYADGPICRSGCALMIVGLLVASVAWRLS